jgi:hypothetical protein
MTYIRPSAERNSLIYKMRKYGFPFQEIADKFGLSRESIRVICEKEHAKRVRSQTKPTNRGRVIDMGGRRDVDIVWTPEMQAKEFGLI